jgi:hypothetical protein
MHPMDHMSNDWSYLPLFKMASGGLYHRVQTTGDKLRALELKALRSPDLF